MIGSNKSSNDIDVLDQAHDQDIEAYADLLHYIQQLANHKMGYPVSLLTHLGVVDNRVLGIQNNSLANILLNNVGDPFKDSETSLMEVKVHERLLIAILEHYFGLNKDEIRGYVTTGGTEGNFAGIWWSKRYLINSKIDILVKHDDIIKHKLKEEQELTAKLTKTSIHDYHARADLLQKMLDVKNAINEHKNITQELLTPTVFYAKGHTHYSVPKIAEISRLNIRPVLANPDGSINLNELKKELLFHLSAHPHSAVILVANIGTTISGAIDDVPGIKKVLEEMKPKPLYTIHMDGALTGFVLPILEPFGNIPNYFTALGVNTLVFSAHKYPGLSQPCGIILATKPFFDKAFEKSERNIDYVGNILDITVTGSRSGLNVLMFYNALRTLGLDKNTDKLKKMVEENMETGAYLRDELIKIYGPDKVHYPFHFNIRFPRPSAALAKKYQLMLTGDFATICVLTNITKNLIDKFIVDLKLDLNETNKGEQFMTKTTTKLPESSQKADYTIKTLGKEHVNEVKDLFIKTFCDHEPVTKHLGITYEEYEPFALEVIEKAVKDGLSVVAIDRNNHVIACTIAEDITNHFEPHLSKYPKMEPIFALIDSLSKTFMSHHFKKGKVSHTWIAMVDKKYHGLGLSTEIDLACTNLAASKGYDFTYAEFTNVISENISHHYDVSKKVNEISYDSYKYHDQYPFKGVQGSATTYILGIKPGVKIDALENCYSD